MAAEVHQMQDVVSAQERKQLIVEADRQTQAIMRLEVYKRLGYSAVAAGALLIYWQTSLNAASWFLPAGIGLVVISGLVSIALTVGISRAKKNVRAILAAAGIDLDAVPLSGSHKESKLARAVTWASSKAESYAARREDIKRQ
ncbi:hypothetical protein EII22_07185 [Coriobacteriales bacterium OH1046]|mgnify:CR=1 FL=1|nr:hypothetical protein EII22_07185 [Coriobacteriales bacterium OH1046]